MIWILEADKVLLNSRRLLLAYGFLLLIAMQLLCSWLGEGAGVGITVPSSVLETNCIEVWHIGLCRESFGSIHPVGKVGKRLDRI